ncbi:DUF2092 domain-containing protein [Pseudomonas sp. Pseusp122]|uniref:DUF2092 domain-containing protein n=1 Tax=unclassified Pseudomonas TaxID=196821 RepID=UPI0039A70956
MDKRCVAPLWLMLGISAPTLAAQPDPKALAALQQTGRYLHALPYFTLDVESFTDRIVETGQVIETPSRTRVLSIRPDKLQVTVDAQQFFYDGKHFTLHDSASGHYATIQAPAGIDPLFDQFTDRYGIALPLADLFQWDASTASKVGIDGAQLIGKERIGDQTCTHYAYRQPSIDWQLWVREGARPLPCRLVIVRNDINGLPRHSVNFDWDINRQPASSAFTFNPPAGASVVPLKSFEQAPGS